MPKQVQQPKKFHLKFLLNFLAGIHDADTDIRLKNLDNTLGNSFTEFIPEAKQGLNFGVRGNYNFWNNVSAYGHFGYSNNSIKDFANIQSMIDPLLGLLTSGIGTSIIDPSSIRINVKQNGNYNLMSSNIGIRYDYLYKEKYSFGAYAGIGYYSLQTPGVQVDFSGDVSILGITTTIPLNNLIELDRTTESAIGWQAGVNLTYQITSKFYAGLNFEYNQAKFDYSSMKIEVNENSIPSLLSGLLPVDLGLIPDIPVSSEIDLSSFKYGLIFGMRI